MSEESKLLYTMGDVCEIFDLPSSTIRYWEQNFPMLKPKRNAKGNRLFDKAGVEQLRLIYHLVKERGMTIEGAKNSLKGGSKSALGRDAELLERLESIRSMLVEVREELKFGDDENIDYIDNEIELVEDEPIPMETAQTPSAPKRSRSKSTNDGENKELFAYYDQRLF